MRDRLLRHAVVESYRDLLPRGRFPIGVIFLDVPPGDVDVNVHPAKWEVRFTDPQAIHRAIRHAIRDAMSSRRWLGGLTAPAEDGRVDAPPAGAARGASDARPWPATTATTSLAATTDDWILAGGGSDHVADRPHESAAWAGVTKAPVVRFGSLPILGQLRASYLLAETEDGLIVIDQHAAHERILYEGLRKQWLESGVSRQGLLTPISVELAPASIAALESAPEIAERLGFEIEAFGEGGVLVRAVPAELSGQDVVGLVTELAAALEELPQDAQSDASAIRWLPSLDRLFATLACHSARRFGDRLPDAEQRAILAGLDTIPWAPTCPHGRPVAVLIRHEDLETRFRRR